MAGTPVTHTSKLDTKCSVEVAETEKASPITQQSPVFVVGFEEPGINDPRKWSRWYRKLISVIMTFCVGMMISGSIIQASYAEEIQAVFGFNSVVLQLLVCRSMIWLCVGPLFWGALSDKYGRKPTLVMSYLLYITFSIGATLSRDAASLLFFKILAGFCGAGPPPIFFAALSDIWEHPSRDRGITFTLFSMILPPMSGLASSFLGPDNWRAPGWMFIISAGVFLLIVTAKILRDYAKCMRLKTQDGRYLAPSEVFQNEAWPLSIRQVLSRPFGLLREPLLVGTSIHLMLLMASLQIAYTAFPIAFENYPRSAGAVIFIGSGNFSISIGQLVSALVFVFVIHPHVYLRWGRMYAPDRSPPETRLKLAIWASVLLLVSFVWSGATLTPSISGWVPIVGGLMMGMSSILIVLVMFNYIMDLYEKYAGSALAWCVAAMFVFESVFPLFSDRMMQVLTPRWAMFVAGAGALITIPFPWLFKRYGRVLREYSQYIQ
ncbi:MFS general substrate transporter [Ganoderma sinense ZZ0214-1]|uniref:MFS general substrate transporter n=1 Tax=Ganoderma sinense ZZ0214-1 TaxID=1077348 RepID=A0A2G8S1L3_9APHY|nr:MFS general substrate transporter [Ganoderma sinense ZZ0214-1]